MDGCLNTFSKKISFEKWAAGKLLAKEKCVTVLCNSHFHFSKGTVVEKSQWNPNHLRNKIASFLGRNFFPAFYVFTFFPRNAFNRVSRCWTCHVKWVTLNGLNWRCLTNMWWTWKLWIVEFAFGGSAKIVKSSLWYWSEFRSAGKKMEWL